MPDLDRIAAVVLAAGKGTRMKSELPKVLFPVAGKPMLQHIVDTLNDVGITEMYVVVGHGSDKVVETIKGPSAWVEQQEQLGTGHALAQAAVHLHCYPGHVLVLPGDAPLLTASTLRGLLEEHMKSKNASTVLSAQFPEPTGYGRIIRGDNGSVTAIVEEKDADSRQRAIQEINSGTFCFHWPTVGPLLRRLSVNNAQGEYYLTEIVSLLVLQGEKTGAYVTQDAGEVAGVNDRVQLAWVEKALRTRINHRLMRSGVTIVDPDSAWIDTGVKIGADSVVLPNTHIYGETQIGNACIIGPDTTLKSCQLGSEVMVRNSIVEQSSIGDGTTIGPFAYIRPGTEIGSRVKVGDFVEVKNSRIGHGSKVPHLSYVGDATVGSDTNIGCGVITANYDGVNKNRTEIGDNVFIGSNSNLVAPVKIEDGAYVAAGSTITDNVPAKALAIARSRQTVKADWRKKD